MNNTQEIVQSVMREALTDYQKFVKKEMNDATPEDFEDRGKLMKDIGKKWKKEKTAGIDPEKNKQYFEKYKKSYTKTKDRLDDLNKSFKMFEQINKYDDGIDYEGELDSINDFFK